MNKEAYRLYHQISIIDEVLQCLSEKGLTSYYQMLDIVRKDINERFDKLLQLEPRTIETLEVGDYYYYLHPDGTKTKYNGTINFTGDLNRIKEKHQNLATNWRWKIKIIPHEALEILKEVIG